MKIIRWLFSHLFLILLVVVVIYGYMFWGNLLGKETPAGKMLAYLSSEFVEVDEFIHAVKAKQAQLTESGDAEKVQSETRAEASPESSSLASTKTNNQAASIASDEVEEKTVAEVEPASVASRNISQLPVSISYSHNQMRVKQNSIGQIESKPEAASTKSEPETQSEAVVKASVPVTHTASQVSTKIEPSSAIAPEIRQNKKSLLANKSKEKTKNQFVSEKCTLYAIVGLQPENLFISENMPCQKKVISV